MNAPDLTDIRRVHETRNVWELAQLVRYGWRVIAVLDNDPGRRPLFILGSAEERCSELDSQLTRALWMGARAHTPRILLHRAAKALLRPSTLGVVIRSPGAHSILRALQLSRAMGRKVCRPLGRMFGLGRNVKQLEAKEGQP